MTSLPLCRLLLIVCLLFSPTVLTLGCGGDDGSSDPSPDPSSDEPVRAVDVARSPLDRNLAPGAGAADLEALAAGNADFAVDLLGMLGGGDRNLFFSPYSISLALTMAYAGAEGVTRAEMADALQYRLFGDDLHDAFNRLNLILENRQTVPTADSTPPLLYIANALWAQKGHTFLSGYLDALALNYGAGVRLVNFEADPEAAREAINRWVSDSTEGLIGELLSSGTISSLTRLALTNAIYFQAHWESPFDPDSTRDADFFLPGGGRTPVSMMTQKDSFGYAEGIGYQAVELPYVGEELSMVVLLPDANGRPAFERGLTGRELLAICDDLTPELVRVYLPRFSMDPEAIDLDDALSGMGMETAFTEAADFSGMDGTRELAVSNVTHKTFVSVDEFGTEAGAATGVVVGPTSGNPLYTLRADRPFLFLIRDMATRTILFMGRVTDPMDNPLSR